MLLPTLVSFFSFDKGKRFFAAMFLLLSGCSVAEIKHFSQPEQHLKTPLKSAKRDDLVNRRYQKFENKTLPNEFEDSLDHTTITLSLENGYTTGSVGIPLVPFMPIKSGYGHPENKKMVTENESDDKVVLHLMLTIYNEDSVTLNPGDFLIKKRGKEPGEVKPFRIDNILGSSATLSNFTYKAEGQVIRERMDVFFSGAVHVEDLPVVFLSSLMINGKAFYPNGIPFKAGKKKFYSAFVSPE
jgi:hypothetical protein